MNAKTVPGHPTQAGAGYDCNCGECLSLPARREQAESVARDLWACEDCGWRWPLKNAPYQDAECDACGGEMHPVVSVLGDESED